MYILLGYNNIKKKQTNVNYKNVIQKKTLEHVFNECFNITHIYNLQRRNTFAVIICIELITIYYLKQKV